MSQKAIYKDGKTIYFIDGKEVKREEFFDKSRLQEILETGSTPGGTPTSGYPFYSYAAGVGSENINEAQEICRKAGFPTEFNEHGDPLFTSQAHRKKYCKQFELYDRNAGYGDAAPTCKASTEGKKKFSSISKRVQDAIKKDKKGKV